MTGLELRAERERVGVRAADVAIYFDKHPAQITRLERQDLVDPATAKRYRRALTALKPLRDSVRRQLIRELAAR